MGWNPSPEVAVAREAAKKLKAELGVVVVYLNRETMGAVSYGHNKALCGEMGKLADHLHKSATEYFAES